MIYGAVPTRFWHEADGWSDDERLFALYIATGPLASSEGIYLWRPQQGVADLGWPRERVLAAVDGLVARKWLHVDRDEWIVFAPAMLRWNPPKGEKRVKGAANQLARLPSTKLLPLVAEAARLHAPDLLAALGPDVLEPGSDTAPDTAPDAVSTYNTVTDTSTNSNTKRNTRTAGRLGGKSNIPPADIDAWIAYLNERAGHDFKTSTKTHRDHVAGRIREGHTLDDCRAVVDHKVAAWASDPKWQEYLQPSTLFGLKHFEEYLAAARAAGKRRSGHGSDRWTLRDATADLPLVDGGAA